MAIIYPLVPPSTPVPRTFKMTAVDVVGEVVSPFSGSSQQQQWPGNWWDLEVGLPPMSRASAEQWISFLVALKGKAGSFLIGDPNGQFPRGTALGLPMAATSSLGLMTINRTAGGLVVCNCVYSNLGPSFVVGGNVTIACSDATFNGTFPLLTSALVLLHGFPSIAWQLSWNQGGAVVTNETVTGSATYNTNIAGSSSLATSGWTPNQNGVLLAGDWIQVFRGTNQRLYKNLTDANADAAGFCALDIFPNLREFVPSGSAIYTTNTAGSFRLAENSRQWSVDHTSTYGIDFKAHEAI